MVMRRLLVGLTSVAWLASCSSGENREDSSPLEPTAQSVAELVVNQANVFGFEDYTQWKSNVVLSSSTTRTQGYKSLAARVKGYTEITSVALSSLSGVTGTLGLDLLLPSSQSNPNWYGNLALAISVPSKGVNNLTLTQYELTGRPLNQFFSLDFTLPTSLVTTLQAGGYTDLKLKLIANVPYDATGTYLFDNLRFKGSASVGPDLVETDVLTRWSSGAAPIEPVNTTLSVLSGSQAYLGQSALRAVTDAGWDFWLRYDSPTPIDIGAGNDAIRVVSRALNTQMRGGWQINAPVFVLEDSAGAREVIEPTANHLPIDGTTWVDIRAPLDEAAGWTRSGNVDLHSIKAIELHTDTWDWGFTWDIDAVGFTTLFDVCAGTPAPITLSASARATTARLTYSAVPGALWYHVYRSAPGAKPVLQGRARGTTFEDSGLSLGTNYRYEVRAVMQGGCESGSAAASVTTAASAAGLTRIPTFRVLIPFYVGGPDPITSTEVARVKAGIELGRQFYFRNSRGRFNLDLDYFEINTAGPSTQGVTMDAIAADLVARGIMADQYDGVFAQARNLDGCWGNFGLPGLGRTLGAYAWVCGLPYPTLDANVNVGSIWNFTHEFQHALDAAVDSVGADMISGHPDGGSYFDQPYYGPTIDAGEHFDWEAATLRMFTSYDTLGAPYNDYIEVEDPDGDGLASNDPRLPWDEARFGSNPNLADTDGDGLDDRAEYAAGVFASSDPLVADTDGDGQRDGVDPTPRAAIAASITSLTPAIDGVRESGYTLFRNGVEFTQVPDFTAATYVAYDANYFYVYAEESQSATLLIQIDGSGQNGYWEGDNTYQFSLTPGQPRPLNHTGKVKPEDHIDNYIAGVAMTGGLLVTRTAGTKTIIEARIPRANIGQGFGWTGSTTTGFPTTPGTVLGLRITFTQFGGSGDIFAVPWATQNEHYHFDDVTLR